MATNGTSSKVGGDGGCSSNKIWTGSLILKKVNRPDLENLRHRDNSLKLWIFEAKRLPPKKRYFCEVCLDHILYARTTTKEKTTDIDPFWGEPFEFSNLQDIALVTVKLFREADRKKKKDKNQLVGEVRLGVHDIGAAVEQWYALETPTQQAPVASKQLLGSGGSGGGASGSSGGLPCIRLRSHYISIDVLPLQCYRGLHEYLMHQSGALVAALEPRLALRDKEELAARLISVAHARGRAEPLLADLVMQELAASANDLLVFRGNSIATKAVEFYLRLTGCDYLTQVMSEPLSILLKADPACEVDPQRVDSAETLAGNQRCLREYVDLFWARIQQSATLIPPEISRLFALIRQRLAETRRQELGDTLVSASLFLRLICPAILGPSLFGLTKELPSQQSARALTLIAKTVQNLANGTLYGAKEAYMQFMNRFLEDRSTEMRLFLKAASRPGPPATALPASAACVDLGCELAQLHALLSAASGLGQQQQQLLPQHMQGQPQDWPRPESCITALSGHLTALTHCLRHGGYAGPMQHQHQQPPGALTPEDDWVYSNVAESSPPPQVTAAVTARQRTTSPQQPPLPMPPPPPQLPLPSQPMQQQPQQLHRLPSAQRQSHHHQQAQHVYNHHPQSIQEDWKKMLEEAHMFSTVGGSGSGSGGGVGNGGVGAASTTGSSGYQSFAATSPVQFFNPTYQKGGLPPLRSQPGPGAATASGFADDDDVDEDAAGGDDYEGDEDDEDDEDLVDSPRREGGSSSSEMASSEASSVGPSAPSAAAALAKRPTAEAGSQIRWDPAAEATRLKTRSLGPAFASHSAAGDPQAQQQRVRMGVRATQQSPQQQQQQQPSPQAPQPPHQPQQQQQQQQQLLQAAAAGSSGQRSHLEYETELQKLQRELMETRQRLQLTEARLRNNEQEKVQLVAQFEHQQQHQPQHQSQQHQQHQPQQHQPQHQPQPAGSPSGNQMQEILQRLQSLETSLRHSSGAAGNRHDMLDSI